MEYYGGFRNLKYDSNAKFPSAIAPNASALWSTIDANVSGTHEITSTASLIVQFPSIDWKFLQDVYGWSALQYQAWARGYITIPDHIPGNASWVLYSDAILEFWIDGRSQFGGDFYSRRKAPLVLHLGPGVHTLDVRLIRDVRAMGGLQPPTLQVGLELRRARAPLECADEMILVSDVVDGTLPSKYASITLRNNGKQALTVFSAEPLNVRFHPLLSCRSSL